ncbi:hypothetical protein EZS27_004968, partial [termite gut metagenome]
GRYFRVASFAIYRFFMSHRFKYIIQKYIYCNGFCNHRVSPPASTRIQKKTLKGLTSMKHYKVLGRPKHKFLLLPVPYEIVVLLKYEKVAKTDYFKYNALSIIEPN